MNHAPLQSQSKPAAKWERVQDAEGDVYYYNPVTGQSSWVEPDDMQ